MTITETNRAMSLACIERMQALGLKGKKREDEALSYCVGFAKALEMNGLPVPEGFMFLVSLRGWSYLVETATED